MLVKGAPASNKDSPVASELPSKRYYGMMWSWCNHDGHYMFTQYHIDISEGWSNSIHYNDVIMSSLASQITSPTIVYLTVYSDPDQRKHQSSASLAFVWGIHRWPVNSPHKWPVTRKMFPFDDVSMIGTNDNDIHGDAILWACRHSDGHGFKK